MPLVKKTCHSNEMNPVARDITGFKTSLSLYMIVSLIIDILTFHNQLIFLQ